MTEQLLIALRTARMRSIALVLLSFSAGAQTFPKVSAPPRALNPYTAAKLSAADRDLYTRLMGARNEGEREAVPFLIE